MWKDVLRVRYAGDDWVCRRLIAGVLPRKEGTVSFHLQQSDLKRVLRKGV